MGPFCSTGGGLQVHGREQEFGYGHVPLPAAICSRVKLATPCAVAGVTWNKQEMFDYLENPKKYIKGTNMARAAHE